MKPVLIDYETFYHKTDYSVRDLGNWRYCADPRFDAYLVSVYDGTEGWVGHPSNLNWDALQGCLLLAHNASFDSRVTTRLTELGKAPSWLANYNHINCTANMTSALLGHRSLDAAILAHSGEYLDKGIRDQMAGLTWDQMVEKGMAENVAKYAMRDSVKAFKLWNDLSPKWSSFEQRISQLTLKQCARGVAIDVPLLDSYMVRLREALFFMEKNLPWVAEEGAKPTSPKAIASQCRKVGIPAPPVKTHDEEGFDKWLLTYGPQFKWVAQIGEFRKLHKLMGTLETIKERLRPDGTIDFSLLYFGAHTGRFSGGGAGLNLQNLRKTPLYLMGREIVFPPAELLDTKRKKELAEWLAVNTDLALDVRRLLIARPGKQFIIPDLSQIEPRCLNWLAGNHDLLRAIEAGYSYYEAYAKLCEAWRGEPNTIKGELGDAGYTLLKNKALGLGYQMGPDRFCEYAGVEPEEAQEAVANFRAANPLVVELWNTLEVAFKRSHGKDFEMDLPSGRTLTYRDVRRVPRMKKNKETGKPETKLVFTADVGGKRVELYGGKLTENITQAMARDVFCEHLLTLEQTVGDVIFHVHDEAIVECDLDVKVKDVEDVMRQTPGWCPGLPLASEAKISQCYKK